MSSFAFFFANLSSQMSLRAFRESHLDVLAYNIIFFLEEKKLENRYEVV